MLKPSIICPFTDDTNIFVAGGSHNEAVEKANMILDSVSRYKTAYKLHINLENTCFMYFKVKQSKVKPDVEIKFLGVTIDNNLSWEHGKLISTT